MDLLGTRTAWELLKTLLKSPLQEWKEIDLIRAAGTGKGAASASLAKLAEQHVILKKKVGKATVYALNLKSTSTFFIKTLCDAEKINPLPIQRKAAIFHFKRSVQNSVNLLILFGSTAAGTATAESDIDLLIVSPSAAVVEKNRKETEELFGERLNIHYAQLPDFITKKDMFLQNILLQGIVLHGYDLAKELFSSLQPEQETERLFFFLSRLDAAGRNYQKKDHAAAEEIITKTVEQLTFYLLSVAKISYISKQDAFSAVAYQPQGKSIQKINKAALPEKIRLSKELVIQELQKTIIGREGYASGRN